MAGAEDVARLMRMARKDFHDLVRLFTLLSEARQDVHKYVALAELGVYAVQARYEEGLGSDEPLDRSAVVANVNALLAHIERQLSH